jgi:2-iminobutanoate/2-iminopropanoate deaminase
MPGIKMYSPKNMPRPRSTYSHMAEVGAGSKLVFIAGQVPIDMEGKPVGIGDIDKQCAQVFANIGVALRAAGADWKNVVQFLNILVRREDIPKFTAYRERELPKLFPDKAYPPSTLVVISSLAHEAFLVEVQVVAAI